MRRLRALFDTPTLAELGPARRPGTKPAARLREEIRDILDPSGAGEPQLELITGLALLWHDHLEAAHEIAQGIETADGSLLHAIMHRREPDYSNAKYWFQRARQHPLYSALGLKAAAWASATGAPLPGPLAPNGVWDPLAFVDACQAAARQAGSGRAPLEQLQQLEFEAFLEHLCQSSPQA
jgi:hypothetical protein